MKRLLSTLLPRDARENILGDLAERGMRLRDIASVLPRVWWSHLVRTWNAPVFLIAGASESAIRSRYEQFRRRRLLWASAPYLLMLGLRQSAVGIHRARNPKVLYAVIPALIVVFIAAMAVRRLRQLNPLPEPVGRDGWLNQYRTQLGSAILQARLGALLIPCSPILLRVRVDVLVPVCALWILLSELRARRLRRQREALK